MSDGPAAVEGAARTPTPMGHEEFDDLFNYLALPDPFVTGDAVRPRQQSMPASNNEVIDLTDSPPGRTATDGRHEIIDLDSIPDQVTRPYVPQRRPTPSDATERARIREEAGRGLGMATGERDHPYTSDSSVNARARRRQWLLETAERRTEQRLQRERQDAERPNTQTGSASTATYMSPQGMLVHGLNQLGAQYRAYVHGPNGGGPVNGNTLPHHFLSGGNLAFFPRLGQFRRPELDYAMFNQVFPPYREPAAPPNPPKYVAPDPCKEPFTRTFDEKAILVCPGCRSELGGVGDEAKRKIFISKCSHVYCGDCGSEIKGAAKRQGIICRAPGCEKKITKARIFEAYI